MINRRVAIEFAKWTSDEPFRRFDNGWRKITNDPKEYPYNFSTVSDDELFDYFMEHILLVTHFTPSVQVTGILNDEQFIEGKWQYSSHGNTEFTDTSIVQFKDYSLEHLLSRFKEDEFKELEIKVNNN